MDWCGRIDCPLYRQGDSCLGRCYKESVLYRSVCKKCEASNEDKQSSYEGETSRSIYTRYKMHLSDYAKAAKNNEDTSENSSSWMWDHIFTTHNGQVSSEAKDDFRVQLVSKYRHPMDRQIAEAIRIEKSFFGAVPMGKTTISCRSLNRKCEHFAPFERKHRDVA